MKIKEVQCAYFCFFMHNHKLIEKLSNKYFLNCDNTEIVFEKNYIFIENNNKLNNLLFLL